MGLVLDTYILEVIFLMTVATFFCRSFPYWALKKVKHHPAIHYIGHTMPPMIMTLLVLYSLMGTDIKNAPYGLKELLATSLTALCHIYFNNALLSIGLGTALYMVLEQTGVLGF